MKNDEFIAIHVFARHQGVDPDFIHALHERGLIELIVVQEEPCARCEELARIEQLARLHYDLDINLEGLEAISHLLERMDAVQEDLRAMRERLQLYEGE